MCKLCETKPVYEFTNKRKVCKSCFIRWFQKKILYTIRKFSLIEKNDLIGYESGKGFRSVVLENVLKMYSEKAIVEVVRLHSKTKPNKIAIASTIDSESQKIVHELIKGDVKNLKEVLPITSAPPPPHRQLLIKPLYLFLDKEVLLYAKLKGLKFAKVKKEKADEIGKFVNGLEKKHPEVKRAIVKGVLEINFS